MAAAANPRERLRSTTTLSVELPPVTVADEAIRSANAELEQRVGSGLNLAIAVLVEQRDQALRRSQSAREHAERDRDARVHDQDAFIAFLMADHEKQLAELGREITSAREELARSRALGSSHLDGPLAEQVQRLQEALSAAYAEIDDTRSDAARLQDERDSAIRETNDLRFEFEQRIESVRDEASALQWELDEGQRKFADLTDQARDDAYRAAELLDDAQKKLDERNEEVRMLRARLTVLDEEMQSRPPPAAALELENARKEAQILRKSLIDAKREISRLSNGADSSRLRARTSTEDVRPSDRDSVIRKR